MRKILVRIAVLICLIFTCFSCLSACSSGKENGLVYELSYDESYYTVKDYSGDSKEIIIPAYYNDLPVTEIEEYAFAFNDSITKLTISEGITRIGAHAFDNCPALKNINVPNSVEFIGEYAFDRCPSLEYNMYDNANYIGNESNPYVALVESTNKIIASCDINDGTKLILHEAFNECSSLRSIKIPNNIIRIEKAAFKMCTSLRELSLGENLIAIGDKAFNQCGFIELTIPDKVTYIGSGAFASCHSLIKVTLGRNVNLIMSDAFLTCFKLVEVYNLSSINISKKSQNNGMIGYYALNIYKESNNQSRLFTDNDGFTYYYNEDSSDKTCYLLGYNGTDTTLTLPNSVSLNGKAITQYEIYNSAFYESLLDEIILSDSVTAIGDYAFCNSTELKKVTIAKNVRSIGTFAFFYCSNLNNAYFEDSNGWYIDGAVKTNLSDTVLEDDSIAASYLKNRYDSIDWKKL